MGGLCLMLVVSVSGAAGGAPISQTASPDADRLPTRVLQLFQSAPSPTPIPELTPAPTTLPEATPTPTPAPTPEPTPAAPDPPPTEPAPSPAPAPPPPPPPPPKQYADTATAAAVLSLTNELRAQNGLPPLAANSALSAAAQAYSETMAVNDWFAHEGPDGSTLATRATAAGYTGWTFLAENLYSGYSGDSAEAIISAWAASPGHLQAILSTQATEIGVGCYVSGAARYCVQDFGAR